jgi:hypothetical protein
VILLDVNVLVYAGQRDAVRHVEYRDWLAQVLRSGSPVGVAPESLGAVVRITTHKRLWKTPLSTDEALAFAGAVRSSPSAHSVVPGPSHWDVFVGLCRVAGARGNLVTDAWLAALAIDQGCTLVTTDRDFARFKGLRFKHPLD